MGTLERMFRASGFSTKDQTIIKNWLGVQLEAQVNAKLEQGGHTVNQIPLRSVFVDLPVSSQIRSHVDEERVYFLRSLLDEPTVDLSSECSKFLRNAPKSGRVDIETPRKFPKRRLSAHDEEQMFASNLLIGGPGQGKSTLSQLASQVHRAALLKPYINELSMQQAQMIRTFDEQNVPLNERLWPVEALLPLQVSLPDLATWLAKNTSQQKDESATPLVLNFIAQLASSKSVGLNSGLLRHATQSAPLLLVFDGFDEVGASEDRQRIVAALQDLIFWLAAREAKVQIIATTRPQGYSGELANIGVALNEHYLTPLVQREALEYAEKLFIAKISDLDDRQKMLGRIQEAARDSSTARLLTTPLQVTILAALVQQIGRAPRERWKLFERYFSYTYDREIERDTYASNLLSVYKPQILRIHARVGLMLQVEAERDGGASARMPRDRLIEVINSILIEDEFSEDDQRQLAHDIAIAAEHRLVFIVEPEPNSYGFEIRSLQEFMAAWAITEGRDSEVESRIKLISGAAIFRNVILFIASRLYSEASPLRDEIAKICGQLDSDGDGESGQGNILIGSVLALEILEEGSVNTQPKRARAMMERALGILRLPLPQLQVRLASVTNGDTRSVLLSRISLALEEHDTVPARNAWIALTKLSSENDLDANVIIERNWGRLSDPQSILLECNREDVPLSSLMFKKIEEQACLIDARYINNSHTPQINEVGSWAEWFNAVQRDRPWASTGNVVSGSMLTEQDIPLPGEPDYPLPDSWKIHYLWLKFENSPTHLKLAEFIDGLITLEDVDSSFPSSWLQSWPVRAICTGGQGRVYLSEVSARLKKGLLGTVDNWREAQKNWGESRVADFFGPNWDSMPWDPKRIMRVPPAFLVPVWATRHDSQFDSVDEFHSIVRQLDSTSNRKLNAWLATHALFYMRMSQGNLRVSIEILKRLLDIAPEKISLLLPKPRSILMRDWIHLVDRYNGPMDNTWLLPPEIILQGYNRKTINSNLLVAAVKAIPEETHGLGFIDEHRESLKSLLEKSIPDNKLDLVYIWVLKLYTNQLPPENDARLIEIVGERVIENPWLLESVVHALRWGKIGPARVERFLTALLPVVTHQSNLLPIFISMLQALAGSKKTNIEAPSVWSRLGFGLPAPYAAPKAAKVVGGLQKNTIIREIEIVNIGRIRHLKLTLPVDLSENGQWIVLLGQNGAGKSTILRSVVIGLRNAKEPTIWPGRAFNREWNRVDSEGVSLEGKIRVSTDDLTITTSVTPGSPPIFYQAHDFVESVPVPVFAYGCRRGSATGGANREVDLAEGMEVATLMDDSASLIHAETWLKDLDGEASKTNAGKMVYRVVRAALCDLLDLKSIWVANKRVWVQFEVGAPLPFSDLSDGYLTSAGWLVDLVARWINFQEQKGQVIPENFMSIMSGLVLIDELDLHLHPKWQVEIIRKTRQLLPRMSFIVTTHNPLTLVGASASEIWHLEVDQAGEVTASQGIDPPLLLTGGQLYRRYFGIKDVYPSNIGRSMQRVSFLSGLPSLTDEEYRDFQHHKAIINAAGIPLENQEGEAGNATSN